MTPAVLPGKEPMTAVITMANQLADKFTAAGLSVTVTPDGPRLCVLYLVLDTIAVEAALAGVPEAGGFQYQHTVSYRADAEMGPARCQVYVLPFTP